MIIFTISIIRWPWSKDRPSFCCINVYMRKTGIKSKWMHVADIKTMCVHEHADIPTHTQTQGIFSYRTNAKQKDKNSFSRKKYNRNVVFKLWQRKVFVHPTSAKKPSNAKKSRWQRRE